MKRESETQENPYKKTKSTGRNWTVSIAIPGSIVDNAQSPELKTYLAGQIARACVIFNVDEIVVFREEVSKKPIDTSAFKGAKHTDACMFLARVLQYLECPQYLRKQLFPMHPDLKYAGILNPLDCPHHPRIDEESAYREGIVLKRPTRGNEGSYVNVGTKRDSQIDRKLKPNVRVTVEFDGDNYEKAKAVSYKTPREKDGIYWGYRTRVANSIETIFSECPFGEYDLTIGTSERGDAIDDASIPQFNHLLIVFGGLAGLEAAIDTDDSLSVPGDHARKLFDLWLNTCPNQGSRTIRTEEAILVTLSALRSKFQF